MLFLIQQQQQKKKKSFAYIDGGKLGGNQR